MAGVHRHWDHVMVTWKVILLHFLLLCIQIEMGVDSNPHTRKARAQNPRIIDGLDISFSTLPNLLVNPSFEEAFPPKRKNPWIAGKATLSREMTNAAKDGEYVMLVSRRRAPLDGATQIVRGLKPGKGYALSGFIRIMKDKPNTLWQRVKVNLQFTFTDDPEAQNHQLLLRDERGVHEDSTSDSGSPVTCARSGKGQKSKAKLKPDRSMKIGYNICYRTFITTKGEDQHGWVPLVGDINAPMREFADEVSMRIAGPDPEVDFQVDDLKLVEVPPYDDWLTRTTRESDIHRKAPFTLKFTLPAGVSAKDIDVEVKLKNPLFPFGVKVEDDCMVAPEAARYRDFVSKVFNWVAIGSYKWRFDKGTREMPDFSNAINANKVASKLGLKVRAHSILWDIEENTPDWVVHDVSDAELPEVVRQHVVHMINITRGKVEQWDVQNEMVVGHYYEERLQDPNFTAKVFKMTREQDPEVRLYLNDFQAVTTGSQVAAIIGEVKRIREFGAEINGVGIQAHTKDYVKPDPPMIWRRLNEFGKLPDLEVMITEFDLGHDDDVTRADWIEDTMRAFHAHPVLKGVNLWGFWSERMRYENKFLVYGEKFEMSETGRRVACLVEKEWTTRLTFNLGNQPQQVQLKGYKGDYDVIVRKNNVAIQRESFALTGTRDFSIEVVDSTTPIQVPGDNDFMSECISHRNLHSLGEMLSDKTQPGIQCTSRNRTVTSGAEETKAEVTCSSQEVMTGCSGSVSSKYSAEENIQARVGETVTFEGGVPKCNAFLRSNCPQGEYQVTAEARCCVIPGLRCDYRRVGPSLLMEDAMAEASCLPNALALGCATYNPKSLLKGVVDGGDNPKSCVGKSGPPTPESKFGGASGVVTSAACCAREGLDCVVVKSGVSEASNVSCPRPQQVMTSCMAQGTSSKASACKDTDGHVVCRVQGHRVTALATCCRIQGLNTNPSDVTPPCSVWHEDVVGKPADVVGKPADVVSKPADVVSKPADVVGKPAEASKNSAISLRPLLGFFGILLNVVGVFML